MLVKGSSSSTVDEGRKLMSHASKMTATPLALGLALAEKGQHCFTNTQLKPKVGLYLRFPPLRCHADMFQIYPLLSS